jgi:hypothetical protein
MYSSVETYYTLRMDKIYEDEVWHEVELMILSGGNPDKPTLTRSAVNTISLRTIAPVVQPISLYQNESYLKVGITLDERINIKVLDAKTDLPAYMRQYVPGGSNEVMINTSRWSGGYYNIIFTNSSGEVVAKSTIYID